MTSSNTTEFIIRDLSGKEVGRHCQSDLCKTKWHLLLKFQPPENFTIQATWYDEEEEYQENEEMNLKIFIDKLKKNRASFEPWEMKNL